MNAFAKWLAKYAERLTSAEKEVAHNYMNVKQAIRGNGVVFDHLASGSPKEADYIQWMMRPEEERIGGQFSAAHDNMMRTFAPDYEKTYQTNEITEDLLNAIKGDVDSVNPYRHTPKERVHFNYRKREKF